MSEVPNESERSHDDLEPGLRLHTSPTALKQSQLDASIPDQPNNDSFSDSDASGIHFPPANRKSLGLRYSADSEYSDTEAIQIGDSEQSIRLDSLVDGSLQANSSSSEAHASDTSTLEISSSEDQEEKRSKQKRPSLGPNEFPKVNLEEKEENEEVVVFKKNFEKLGTQMRPLKPLVESEEEHPASRPRIDSSIDLKNMIDAELALNERSAKDPYVLNIIVHIPKEYSDQNIPLNVNIIKHGDNSSEESAAARIDASMVSSRTQDSIHSNQDIRNSTFISEIGDISEEIHTDNYGDLDPIHDIPEIQPVHSEQVRTIDDIPPEAQAMHLNETLPVAVKTEPVDTTEESVPEPGPSKPSASSKTTKTAARPRKTNSKKGAVENKPPPKKPLKENKPKENVKTNKETSTKKGAKKAVTNKVVAKKETAKKDVAKKDEAEKIEVANKDVAKKDAAKKDVAKKGGSKKEQAKKPSKEESKKGRTAKERLESVHRKCKNKHTKVNKKNKCKVAKMACRHCEAESSDESEYSSECSVCSGDYCRRSSSSEDSSSCDSDSSTCTCSSCQHSSTSDYESRD